jgi:probable phosphoglycerate mutase
MVTVILVRHGENAWVKKGKLAGWLPDIHLNENGYRQAAEAAERLAHLPVKAVYSSPITRCMETAEAIARAHALDIVEIEELGEVRYGDWEGKKIKKLAREPLWFAVQFYPSRMRFPGGEALREVQSRAVQGIERLTAQHADETVVLVSHADVIRLVLAHYLGVHIDLFQRLVISPGAISVLQFSSRGMARVVRFNDDGPLRPSAPEKPAEKAKPKEKAQTRQKSKRKN